MKPPLRTIQPTVPQLEVTRCTSGAPGGAHGQGANVTSTGGGGMQVVLDANGPWTDLQKNKHSGGMLAFLSKRRGRGSSPKPQERGVLGREGARVVVG